MRWVDRGPEPPGVAGYAGQFTQGWVNHFVHDSGGRPTDAYWGQFRPQLRLGFSAKCGYCERRCDSESRSGDRPETVDHFRPLNRFPQLAYEWTNWVFSCRSCNNDFKKDKWPDTGYVDPCAPDVSERPEQYFDCDRLTGELTVNGGLTGLQHRRGRNTRDDLGLNRVDLRKERLALITRFKQNLLEFSPADRRAFAEFMMGPEVEFCGIIRMIVAQLRQSGVIPSP